MIEHYFSSISDEVKLLMVKDLQETVRKEQEKNKELQQFYDDLMNTEGLYHMNMVAKQLKIGRNTSTSNNKMPFSSIMLIFLPSNNFSKIFMF